ncbi:hypothetical protein GGI35DRAFT_367877 [Trichoderma velutinum]
MSMESFAQLPFTQGLSGKDPEEPTIRQSRATYIRSRAVTACQNCRDRKRKCDNERPSCTACLKVGGRCEYSVRDASTFDASSLAILDRLSVIEDLLRKDRPNPLAASIRLPTSELDDGSYASPPSPKPTIRSKNVLSLARIRTDTLLSWPVFRGALSSLTPVDFIDQNNNHCVTYLSDCLTRPAASHSISMSSTVEPDCPMLSTSRIDVEPLISRFFQEVHTKNPILDLDAVIAYTSAFYEQGVVWDAPTCLILLICALGSLASTWEYGDALLEIDKESHASGFPSNRSKDIQQAKVYFFAAEHRLGCAIGQPGVLPIQCLCLAGVYHMYTLNPLAALHMFHAAGTAVQISLSTSMPHSTLSGGLSSSSNIIRRLFWTCFKSEREILSEVPLGHLAVAHLDLSEQYPSPPEDKESPASGSEWGIIQENSWYYYLAEMAIRRIIDSIVDTMYPEDSTTFLDPQYPIHQLIPIAAEFQRQLDSWHGCLPPSLAFSLSPEPVASELVYYLQFGYHRVSELLCRPFLYRAIHSPSPVGHDIAVLAEQGLAHISSYLVASNQTHWHHGRWTQIRRELGGACLLLAASKSGLRMPPEWYAGVARLHETLRYWSLKSSQLTSYVELLSAVDRYFTSS